MIIFRRLTRKAIKTKILARRFCQTNKDYWREFDAQEAYEKQKEKVIIEGPHYEFDTTKRIHPGDFNNRHLFPLKEMFRVKKEAQRYSKIEGFMRGLPQKTEDDLKKEDDADVVAIEVEKLNLWRDIIFFKLYNPKKKLPQMHEFINGLFWWQLLFLLFYSWYRLRTYFYEKEKRKTRTKREEILMKERERGQINTSKGKISAKMTMLFDYEQQRKELNLAFQDLKKKTEIQGNPIVVDGQAV